MQRGDITAEQNLIRWNTNPDEPFTMNDAIRAAINSGSKIVSDFPDLKSLEPSSLSGSAPYHCSNEDLESCYIFLDEYRQ